MANKQIKRCLTLLMIREIQNKAINRNYFTAKETTWANIKVPKMWGKCNFSALLGE